MGVQSQIRGRFIQYIAQVRIKGMGHGRMNRALFKGVDKGIFTKPGKINELIQDHKMAPVDFKPQAAAGGCGKDMGGPGLFQGMYICPVVHLGGTVLVFAAVSCQNQYPGAVDLSGHDI